MVELSLDCRCMGLLLVSDEHREMSRMAQNQWVVVERSAIWYCDWPRWAAKHTHNGPDGDVAGVGGMRAKRIMKEGRNRVKLMLKCTEEATDENYQSVG